MKKTLLLACLAFLPLFLSAKDHLISLSRYRLNVRSRGINISNVIDARPDKFAVGLVRKGPFNKRTVAQMKEGVAGEFMGLMERSFMEEKAAPMIIRINHLYFYEVPAGNKEIAMVDLNISFLQENTDGGFTELLEVGVVVDRTMGDATPIHGANAVVALDKCFHIFYERSKAGQLWNVPVPPEKLAESPLSDRQYPVLSTDISRLPDGAYLSFFHFRDNLVDTSIVFEMKTVKKKISDEDREAIVGKPQWVRGPYEEEEIWGLKYDSLVFVRAGNQYVGLERERGDFVSYLRESPSGEGLAVGYILGGALGGLIGAGIDELSRDREKLYLDFTTGGFTYQETPRFKRLESEVILYTSTFNDEDKPLTVLVDGARDAILGPGSYRVIRFHLSMKETELCIQAGEDKVCKELELDKFGREVILAVQKKDGSFKLDARRAGSRPAALSLIRSGELQRVEGLGPKVYR